MLHFVKHRNTGLNEQNFNKAYYLKIFSQYLKGFQEFRNLNMPIGQFLLDMTACSADSCLFYCENQESNFGENPLLYVPDGVDSIRRWVLFGESPDFVETEFVYGSEIRTCELGILVNFWLPMTSITLQDCKESSRWNQIRCFFQTEGPRQNHQLYSTKFPSLDAI